MSYPDHTLFNLTIMYSTNILHCTLQVPPSVKHVFFSILPCCSFITFAAIFVNIITLYSILGVMSYTGRQFGAVGCTSDS